MHFKCAKNFFAKYCRTLFFAHIGYAVALTANRNEIVFHLLKSSFKIFSRNGNAHECIVRLSVPVFR